MYYRNCSFCSTLSIRASSPFQPVPAKSVDPGEEWSGHWYRCPPPIFCLLLCICVYDIVIQCLLHPSLRQATTNIVQSKVLDILRQSGSAPPQTLRWIDATGLCKVLSILLSIPSGDTEYVSPCTFNEYCITDNIPEYRSWWSTLRCRGNGI